MVEFLNLIAAEPDIARMPVMVDSVEGEVIEAGLKCLQGKGVVNSISLKEGEAPSRHARLVRRYGAAVGGDGLRRGRPADTIERKVEICSRAYKLLTEEVGFPRDIIFDPTSSRRHRHRGTRRLRGGLHRNLPGSNAFRTATFPAACRT